ncbi:MAG: amidohydrolase family protein [Planctomycetaceae bacterium]
MQPCLRTTRQISGTGTTSSVTRRDFITRSIGVSTGLAGALLSRPAAAADRGSPVVDTHMHVWAADVKRFPFRHPYQPQMRSAKIGATLERLVAEMDTFGITHCILVQTIYHGWDNTYTAHCVQQFPKRFKGHGLIDPTDARVADKLKYWMTERGLSGMRFSPIYYQNGQHGGDDWLTSPEHHRLWKTAGKLQAVFNFFIGPNQLPKLGEMAQRFPEVRVVVDHLGQMDLAADDAEDQIRKLLSVARHPNVFVKVSELSSVSKSRTYPFPDAFPTIRRVYDAFGPDRLLWGTGYPGAVRAAYNRPSVTDELAMIRTHIPFLTVDDRQKILGENALKLWQIPESQQENN